MTMTDLMPHALPALAALEAKVTQQAEARAQQHAHIDQLADRVAQWAAQLEAMTTATLVCRPTHDN